MSHRGIFSKTHPSLREREREHLFKRETEHLCLRQLITLCARLHSGSFEVTVTSVSLPPFVSRRGLSNTNQRLSLTLSFSLSRTTTTLRGISIQATVLSRRYGNKHRPRTSKLPHIFIINSKIVMASVQMNGVSPFTLVVVVVASAAVEEEAFHAPTTAHLLCSNAHTYAETFPSLFAPPPPHHM